MVQWSMVMVVVVVVGLRVQKIYRTHISVKDRGTEIYNLL